MCRLIDVKIDISKSYKYEEYVVLYITIKNKSVFRNRKLEICSNWKWIENFTEMTLLQPESDSVEFGPDMIYHPNESIIPQICQLGISEELSGNFVFQNDNDNECIKLQINEKKKIIWSKEIDCNKLTEKTKEWIIQDSHT